MNIAFSEEIKSAAPGLKVMIVEAEVANGPTPEGLSALIGDLERRVAAQLQFDTIKLRPGIAATREAYKALGKEANRYRPAAEQLCRRLTKGQGLYRVNALVDLINVLSVESGYSIGGFDADKIAGDTITLGVGRAGEPYEGIGRGALNIENMPVWRDSVGGFGTPTSDNERTKIGLDTRRLLMTVNIYGEEMPPQQFAERTRQLLADFCGASDVVINMYDPNE